MDLMKHVYLEKRRHPMKRQEYYDNYNITGRLMVLREDIEKLDKEAVHLDTSIYQELGDVNRSLTRTVSEMKHC